MQEAPGHSVPSRGNGTVLMPVSLPREAPGFPQTGQSGHCPSTLPALRLSLREVEACGLPALVLLPPRPPMGGPSEDLSSLVRCAPL